MIISPDFKEFITLLNTHNVRYLVVGGYAVAFHGHPRYTKDIDIWLERTSENAARLLAALDAFGFGSLGLKVEDFLQPGYTIQLGYPPNRIDLLTSLSELDFSTCYDAKIEDEIEGMLMYFIDIEHLKVSKRAAGRPQDLADIDNLTE